MEAEMGKPDGTKNIVEHLKHVDYPVTCKKFSEACDNMSDVSEEEKMWVNGNISMDKTYMSADEIKKDRKISKQLLTKIIFHILAISSKTLTI